MTVYSDFPCYTDPPLTDEPMDVDLQGNSNCTQQPAPQLECMTSSTLLTPPMDEAEPVADEKSYGYARKWSRLPTLSPYERDRVCNLNSLLFDEFIVENPRTLNSSVRLFFAKSRKYFLQYTEDMRMLYDMYKYDTMKRRVFFGMCKECHCVLLANDWTGALEIYQKVLDYDPILFQKDPYMYFGLGVVYIHFKQWREASEAFARLLYNYPTGRVALESKVRLAMCYLELEDYHKCLNLLILASEDSEESQFMPRLVIKYNIGICYENLEELDEALTEYHKLQTDIEIYDRNHGKNIDAETTKLLVELKAGVYRQVGWVSYRRSLKADPADKVEHLKEALKHLNTSNDLNPVDGKNFYFMGRVFGDQEAISNGVGNPETNEVAHAAFVNYRHSIDKSEQNADTWCAIGALYLRKSQPLDALQAFICSIELNPNLTAAWTNLGELYERNLQYQDSLECFRKALQTDPVAPEPLQARVQFLEKELALVCPQRPPNHPLPFDTLIPSLSDAYQQPIPLELRGRQDAAYNKMEAGYDNAYWRLWVNFKTMAHEHDESMGMGIPEIRPMADLEITVLDLLRRNRSTLIRAEREVLECLETSALVWQNQIMETVIQESVREMPRVTEEMIERLSEKGHLVEDPKIYQYSFLPKVAFNDLPDSFSLLSEVFVSVDIAGKELIDQISKRCITNSTYIPIFDEFAKLPSQPVPKKVVATEEDVKAALEKHERHPFLMNTKIMTVDTRKDVISLDLQRHLNYNAIACIRGLTGCLRLDLSMFSTKTLIEVDPKQEIEIRTQYHMPPETNLDHASQKTWKLRSDISYTNLAKYGQYQADSFRQVLRVEAEKMRKYGGSSGRGPSPKRQKLHRRAPSPPKELKNIKFGTNVDLSDEQKYGKHFNELSKLPAFCRLIAGNNMLSHLGHQIKGMNTVSLNMCVPGARVSARQASNNVVTININIGPGDCEWFAVPYEYWGKMEKLCQRREIDFYTAAWWPLLDDLLEEGVPVHRFIQKAGDIVHVGSGSIYWMQATGWCNNISWCVAPMTYNQLNKSLLSYEFNKLRRVKSGIPMQLLCWQMAKNVKFTNQLIYNTCKAVLIRSLAFLRIVADFLQTHKKSTKMHPRTNNEPSHFCRTCLCEVFGILFVKEVSSTFTVFCVFCTKSQGLDEFIVLQQYAFEDLVEIYDNMKYIPATVLNNNNKMTFVA